VCRARYFPFGPRNQGTRRLPVPQRVHTTGKTVPRRPGLLNYFFFCLELELCGMLLCRWLSITVQKFNLHVGQDEKTC